MNFLRILIILALGIGCNSSDKKSASPTPSPGPDVSTTFQWQGLVSFGRETDVIISGSRGMSFNQVSFFSSSDCNISSRINSANSLALSQGITLSLSLLNAPNPVYYTVTGIDGSLESPGCSLLFTYNHDNVAPSAPYFTPASLLAQNYLYTKNISFTPDIPSGYIPSDAVGVNFYGNSSKSIVLGSIRRGETAPSITLRLNLTSDLYISFFDQAGNESSVYSTGVSITHDSIPPAIPVRTSASPLYTQSNSAVISGSTSADTVNVRITGGIGELIVPRSSFGVGVNVSLRANESNIISVSAIDAVGNESPSLNYVLVSDNIAPGRPTVHPETGNLLSVPVKGPSNVFKLETTEESQIRLYRDLSLTNIAASGTSSQWLSGVSVNFSTSDGVNTFYAVAIDLSGNVSEVTTISFIADTTPPLTPNWSTTTNALNNTHVNTNSVLLSGTISGDTSSVIISGGVSEITIPKEDFESGIFYELSPNILNSITARSVDLAGNISSPRSLNIYHDNIPPIFSLSYPLNGQTIKTGGVINGTCESLPVSIEIGANNFSAPCIGGNWNFQIPVPLSLGGVITIVSQTLDIAGNTSSSSSTVSIDNTSPVVGVDASSLTVYSNNRNHLITGTCESGLLVTISGDFSGAVPCLAGFFITPLSINTEGVKQFRIEQTDYAGNLGFFDFQLEFDFTPPPAITLNQSLIDKHLTAITGNNLVISGTAGENLPVKIYRDELFQNLVGVYTTTELSSGITVPLLPDRENSFYIILEDPSKNQSTPAFITVFQRLNMSKKYETIQDNISLSSNLGIGVNYIYKILLTNNSTETNVNKRILIESLTFTTSSPELSVLPTSDCLNRQIVGFGSCEIILSITYTAPAGPKNNTVTIHYPDATTKNITVSHNVDTVLSGAFSSSISPAVSKLFSDHLTETKSGVSFINPQNYYDFKFETASSTAISIARRVQAAGRTKTYLACASDITKLCVYDKQTASLEEFMFPVTLSPLFSSYSAGNSPSVSIRFLGEQGDYDLLMVSAHTNSNFVAQSTAFIKYDRVAKNGVAYALTEGSAYISVQLPLSGEFVYNGWVYYIGVSPSGTSLQRVRISDGVFELISPVLPDTGYLRVKNNILFTNDLNQIVSYNLTSGNQTIVNYINEAGNLKICKNNTFISGKPFNIDERNEYELKGEHGIYLLCNSLNEAKRVVYTEGETHYILEDANASSGQVVVLANIQMIDMNRIVFTYLRTGSNVATHYYINLTTNTFSRKNQSYSGTYIPLAYFANNTILRQNGNSLVREDLDFLNPTTLHTYSDTNWSLFVIRNSPFMLNYTSKAITYYDNDVGLHLSYTSLSAQMNSTIIYEGFYNGYLYLRNGSGGTLILKVPLYSK